MAIRSIRSAQLLLRIIISSAILLGNVLLSMYGAASGHDRGGAGKFPEVFLWRVEVVLARLVLCPIALLVMQVSREY